MIIRNIRDAKTTSRCVTAENWQSIRLILAADGVGFSFHITTMFAGTETRMQYRNHVECVYCIDGEGELVDCTTGKYHKLTPGVVYLLDRHDAHMVRPETDLTIACFFRPALHGHEVHDADGSYPMGEPDNRLIVPNCFAPGDLRFAYLNLEHHPRGERMLERLVAAGFVPTLVIDEASSLAEANRATQLDELKQVADFRLPPAAEHLCSARGIRYVVVPNHNHASVQRMLREADVDLAVLGDTRILRRDVIDCVPFGIVNVHPGLLPDVRGNNPYIWAIIHNLPQGATAHLIDQRVDHGPIILARELTVPPGTLFPELIYAVNELCSDVLVEALSQVVGGEATVIPQNDDRRLTFRAAPPGIRLAAAEILDKTARLRPAPVYETELGGPELRYVSSNPN
jgi:methionyl-tRNA formyltransferase